MVKVQPCTLMRYHHFGGWHGSATETTIGKMRFVGNTLTGGNHIAVYFTASHDWLLSDNVFSRDWAPRYSPCGSTDIMIGSLDARGTIMRNEIGNRGEHPASPDGCAIDLEGESKGVSIVENFIHDSFGAGGELFRFRFNPRSFRSTCVLSPHH